MFVNGISQKAYDDLRSDADRPLFNRALTGQYPPGSTTKPLVALAGLYYGVTWADRKMYAGPYYQIPGQERRYRDWKRGGHGIVDMRKAIAQSCDVYFYDLAMELGIDRMHDFLTKFDLGVLTGIDTVGEARGLMPSREWKRAARGQPWFPGETVITGIGQGYMLATPLQLAHSTAILATRGAAYRPRFVLATRNSSDADFAYREAEFLSSMELKTDWQQIIDSMIAVVHAPNGTARAIGEGIEYKIAGKTGTAQVFGLGEDEEYDAEKIAKKLRDHALFVAFAPAEDPQIAVAVVVENGGSGSAAAAPVARKVIDAYLEKEMVLASHE